VNTFPFVCLIVLDSPREALLPGGGGIIPAGVEKCQQEAAQVITEGAADNVESLFHNRLLLLLLLVSCRGTGGGACAPVPRLPPALCER